MSGGQLPPTRQSHGFRAVYDRFSAYNTLDAKALGKKMADGEVSPQMENLLSRFNPEKYAAAKKI